MPEKRQGAQQPAGIFSNIIEAQCINAQHVNVCNVPYPTFGLVFFEGIGEESNGRGKCGFELARLPFSSAGSNNTRATKLMATYATPSQQSDRPKLHYVT